MAVALPTRLLSLTWLVSRGTTLFLSFCDRKLLSSFFLLLCHHPRCKINSITVLLTPALIVVTQGRGTDNDPGILGPHQ